MNLNKMTWLTYKNKGFYTTYKNNHFYLGHRETDKDHEVEISLQTYLLLNHEEKILRRKRNAKLKKGTKRNGNR